MATDFFTTEVWSWFKIGLSVMCCVIHSGQRTMQAIHITASLTLASHPSTLKRLRVCQRVATVP